MASDTNGGLDADVAIVGAGPVGLVLGIQLAQRGRSVVILEQWPNPYVLPRAVHFDHEVGRIIQSCGIGDEVRAISEPAEIYEWQNGSGTTLLRFGRRGLALSGWPFSSMFCQPDFEGLLNQRAGSLASADIRRGTRVRSIEQRDDHVAVDCVALTPGGGHELVEDPDQTSTIRSCYLVGCDGANSTVRDLLGVGMDDRGFFFDWLIVDAVLDEPRVFEPGNLQVCDPARPTTAVSGGPGRRRWEFMRLPHESIEELDTESRAWELLEPWDVNRDNATLERHTVYTFQARVAEQWQVDRVLLAGDAAHQMPPFAGQGMCAGIRDAMNLAWKLDLVLGGHASPAVLATYDEERRPSANAAVDFSIELGKVICIPDPDEAAARDEAMSAAFDGGPSEVPSVSQVDSGIIQHGGPLAGTLFPQGVVDGRWSDDVHGVGFQLVTVDGAAEDLDDELTEWFATIGGRTLDVSGGSTALMDWFAANDVSWALQRPDFYVFGTAADVRGAAKLLAELRRRLRDDPTPKPHDPRGSR